MSRMPTQWRAVRPQGGHLNIVACNQASREGSEVCETTRRLTRLQLSAARPSAPLRKKGRIASLNSRGRISANNVHWHATAQGVCFAATKHLSRFCGLHVLNALYYAHQPNQRFKWDAHTSHRFGNALWAPLNLSVRLLEIREKAHAIHLAASDLSSRSGSTFGSPHSRPNFKTASHRLGHSELVNGLLKVSVRLRQHRFSARAREITN